MTDYQLTALSPQARARRIARARQAVAEAEAALAAAQAALQAIIEQDGEFPE